MLMSPYFLPIHLPLLLHPTFLNREPNHLPSPTSRPRNLQATVAIYNGMKEILKWNKAKAEVAKKKATGA